MKKNLLYFSLFCFISFSYPQTTVPSGDVSGTWTLLNSPYQIQGDITIPDDSTLSIEPGVEVIFEGHYGLFVLGRLLAIGADTNRISFTVSDTTGFHNSDTTSGGWYGIRFIDTPQQNDTSKIIYCDISYGKAVGPDQPNNSGGAIFISGFSKVLISNCQIIHNSAGGLNSPSGGGLTFRNANVILEKNIISNNTAFGGGGIQIWESNIVFRDNVISHNVATIGGGGVWIGGLSNIEFSKDSIYDNFAGDNGGGISCWQTTNTILDSVIIKNNLSNWGGGVALFSCELSMDNCILRDNSTNGTAAGLGSESSTVQINNTIFERDTATVFGGAIGIYNSELLMSSSNLSSNGAGIRGGGIHSDGSNINIINTTFERDTTTIFGGAIAISNSELSLDNCSLNNNNARVLGGAVHSDFSKVSISNCTFDSDTAGNTGGAIFCWQSELNIAQSIFEDNFADYGGGAVGSDSTLISIYNVSFNKNSANDVGGAIKTFSCPTTISSCSFNESNAVWGGAIYTTQSEFFLRDCSFNDNSSEHGGGLNIGWSNAELHNISFVENSSIWGGGISSTNCNLQIDSCLFYQNSVQNQGGGLEYIADTTGFVSVSKLEITNSKFEENTATTRCAAAIIEQLNSTESLVNVLIDNCEFINNDALRIGVLRIGNISDFTVSNSRFIGNNAASHTAACTFAGYSRGSVYNCLFAKNVANVGSSGGAGVSVFSYVDFMNCTFVNNRAGGGGGMQLRQGGKAVITNNIFWGNYPDQISLLAVNDTSACKIYLNYNDIQFGKDSIKNIDSISIVEWGIGNINSNPLFIDTLNSDFHLQNLSPCLAMGMDSINVAGIWQYAPLTDIEGNIRPSPTGTMPDMGVYESQYPVIVKELKTELPFEFILNQNYPNPFNNSTVIRYSIPKEGLVTLKVYSIIGEEVATLVNETRQIGSYELTFNSDNLTSGVYLYKLTSGEFTETKKMILLK